MGLVREQSTVQASAAVASTSDSLSSSKTTSALTSAVLTRGNTRFSHAYTLLGQQEDIRNYIDNSLKHQIQSIIHLFSFHCGWRYEDDPIVGHRLYREIRKVEVKKAKTKGSQVLPSATYQWETVATNFDEFQDVSVSF
ncbi:hypothetical protein CJ030_MR1G008550 [Morella rubra]|uniref:Uncharacterized protein n=1 Tax=Morella rubra TaxID=262757 RepID=A0A6A1WL75_9ROSI|nr:hypothetical protein CJ030_MR1G008550 [Morella rubra]